MSEKITKTTLVNGLAEKLHISKTQTQTVIDNLLETIAQHLVQGHTVTLTGFGTFSVKERAARTGRNPQTGEAMKIPASKVPHFKPGKELKEKVK